MWGTGSQRLAIALYRERTIAAATPDIVVSPQALTGESSLLRDDRLCITASPTAPGRSRVPSAAMRFMGDVCSSRSLQVSRVMRGTGRAAAPTIPKRSTTGKVGPPIPFHHEHRLRLLLHELYICMATIEYLG